MKTDFKAIQKDLRKLTDLDYLKKELANIKEDIQNFDIQSVNKHVKLTPQAKARLKRLEKQFHDIRARIADVQKQVDSEVNKFIQILRKTKADIVGRASSYKPKRKTSRKKAARKTSRKSSH